MQNNELPTEEYLTAEEVAAWADDLRRDLGYTQAQLAAEIGELRGKPISQQAISNALAGKPGYIKPLLMWLEACWPSDSILFERDGADRPVWRIKLTYER